MESVATFIGGSETVQVWPRSVERKIRARAAPPVANQTLLCPWMVRQVPLAANEDSLVRGAGMEALIRSQFVPPLMVAIKKNSPSTGSLKAIPCCRSQKDNASKKAFGLS